METKIPLSEPSPRDVTREQLMADFKTVIADAEALLKATTNQGGEGVASLRTRVEASLARAKEKMADTEAVALARARAAAKATDVYVHENPWKAIGISAGLALLVGFIMGRR